MNIKNLSVPIAIIIAGAIISASIVFTGGNSSQESIGFGNNNSKAAENMRPVDENDHVFGGSNDAKVTIVEYSDFECPFCARYHPTLERIVEDFGGEVQWVYRHFPLTNIHARATRAAEASECVAEFGGNDAFWVFTEELFKAQRNLSDDLYVSLASSLGVDSNDFTECLNSGRYSEKISAEFKNVRESGGSGTPFTIVINENGDKFPFSGALPYESVRQVVEAALES